MDVVVGRVAKAHGIGGELAVDVHTDSPGQRFVNGAVLSGQARDGSRRPLTITSARQHGSRILVSFAEISGRDAAEAARGTLLLADTAGFEPTGDPDEFYDHQLEGLAARLPDGSALGTVTEVLHTPGGELLSVDHDGRAVLVPFVQEFVPEVDIAGGRVVLDPPEGLFDA